MNNTYFIVGGALVFLVVLWVAVGVRHLKFLKKGVDGGWEFVDEKIRNRHDLAPILVEIIRGDAEEKLAGGGGSCLRTREASGVCATPAVSAGGSADLGKYVEKVISSRDQARRVYFVSGEKTEKEYDYSKALGDLIWFGGEHDKVSKNTYFLEIRKEIENINSDIENRAKEYNEHVRRFNSGVKNFVLRPLAMVTRLKQALIFEFEK